MTDAQGPAGGGGRPRWLPHLSRAGIWLAGAIATAVIGVVVPMVLTGNDDDQPTDERTATPTPSAVPFPPSRQISQEKIGLYNVESDGTPPGAQVAFGVPTSSEAERLTCTMIWEREGVEINFYTLGGGDPCVDGHFCNATITGRDWATSKGLQVGESARRIAELYPEAKQIAEGATIRWGLEPPVSPCGVDVVGGLEAHSGGGRIYEFSVSYGRGGD